LGLQFDYHFPALSITCLRKRIINRDPAIFDMLIQQFKSDTAYSTTYRYTFLRHMRVFDGSAQFYREDGVKAVNKAQKHGLDIQSINQLINQPLTMD
jgi:hypothetical protein